MSLKLGVVGGSPLNGHPFSWSALVNGFDDAKLDSVPFPVIRAYLRAEHSRPEIGTSKVTSIWTPSKTLSTNIAEFAGISNVSSSLHELCEDVDAILHLRDDYWNLSEFLGVYRSLDKAVFVDKPLALRSAEAATRLKLNRPSAFFFSCSPLRFSPNLKRLYSIPGNHIRVDFGGPLPSYLFHAIEPALELGNLWDSQVCSSQVKVTDDGFELRILFDRDSYLTLNWREGEAFFRFVRGEGSVQLDDYPNSFSRTIEEFVTFAETRYSPFPQRQTLKVVELVEVVIKTLSAQLDPERLNGLAVEPFK